MSDLNDKHKRKLIQRYGANEASEKELEAFFGLLGEERFDAALEADMDQEIISLQRQGSGKLKRKFLSPRRIFAAASGVIALSFGLYFYVADNKQESITAQLAKNDVSPGGNKAFLTFEDGSTINLNADQAGIIIDSVNITYVDGSAVDISFFNPFSTQRGDGSLQALKSQQNGKPSIQTLALSTPQGGEYQIILPDNTKVWLNSASTLRYPNQFGGKERRVELTGEAYFEVAKNTKVPFTVVSDGQVVEVLGTQFNINSYADELVTKTTLLEGSVRVSARSGSAVKLAPNQQSVLIRRDETIEVLDVDPSLAIAWKNGDFHFEKTDLQVIMRQLERWYDIEVRYVGAKPTENYTGFISRKKNISSVLAFLEAGGGVSFRVLDNDKENTVIEVSAN